MDKFYCDDFNVMSGDESGHWVRIEELNEMVKAGVIKIDVDKLKEYQEETRTIK